MTIENLPLIITRSQILLSRLERISSDSPWAHQASGVRASIAKTLGDTHPDLKVLNKMVELGFEILEKAAAQIPED